MLEGGTDGAEVTNDDPGAEVLSSSSSVVVAVGSAVVVGGGMSVVGWATVVVALEDEAGGLVSTSAQNFSVAGRTLSFLGGGGCEFGGA